MAAVVPPERLGIHAHNDGGLDVDSIQYKLSKDDSTRTTGSNRQDEELRRDYFSLE